MEHWIAGGTGVTNFDQKDEHIYVKAIEEYGDESLVLISKPIGKYPIKRDHSFHCLKMPKDLSDFWDIFHRIQNEQK